MIFPGPFAIARQEISGPRWIIWGLAGIVAALMVPLLIIITGCVASTLSRGLLAPSVRFGRALRVPLPASLLELEPLTQLAWLVGLIALLSVALAILLWRTQVGLLQRSRQTIESLHSRLLQHSLHRAQTEGAAAQRARVEALIAKELPSLRVGLIAWWQSLPRTLLTMIGCILVALLVDVWLAALAVVSAIFVWRLQVWLSSRESVRMIGWELANSQQRLVELVQQAPLLARLQSRAVVADVFAEELQRVRRRQAIVDGHQARIVPLVGLAALLAVCVVVLALGVNRFRVDPLTEEATGQGMGLPAAVVLALSLTVATISAIRLLRAYKKIRKASGAAEVIYHFVNGDEEGELGDRVGITGLRSAVELDRVTLSGNSGRDILTSLTLRLEPRSLVAVLGTDAVSTAALTELLLGFGKPSDGTIAIDGLPIAEIHPNSLSRQVFWIGQDGPIWSGTVRENLLGLDAIGGDEAMREALRRVGIYERLNDLSDGLSTVVTPDDQRLDSPTRYAVGVARALLRRPAVVVVEEPDSAEMLDDDPSLDALLFLAQSGSLVIILPRRLRTLRVADRVILLNGSRLAGEGKHEALLAGSDLYRHLNYLLFNPYRKQ